MVVSARTVAQRLAFVGVGQHATKLASSLRACGAEVVAHSRLQHHPAPGFGQRLAWPDIVERAQRGAIDAVVAVAPPELTTDIALVCARAGVRCMATKPLLVADPGELGRESEALDADLYVDLWRLYATPWLALKDAARRSRILEMRVEFVGNGPHRGFSGALDWGPHAVAFACDLLGASTAFTRVSISNSTGRGELLDIRGMISGTKVSLRVGNGAESVEKAVFVRTEAGDLELREDGNQIHLATSFGLARECKKDEAVRRFCRAFLSREKSPTLRLSSIAHVVLTSDEGSRRALSR